MSQYASATLLGESNGVEWSLVKFDLSQKIEQKNFCWVKIDSFGHLVEEVEWKHASSVSLGGQI